MSSSLYKSHVEWLFNQFPVFQKIGNKAFKPTLENTLALVRLLEVPIDELKFVHVAGTNGKGTTCSIIASAYTEAGKKVGLFTSPHIKDFRERIRINGEMISENDVINYIQFFQTQDLSFSPSFFEMTWAMALAHFYKEKCDVIIVETGLGGRLDATNIITPLLSVITNIGIDHQEILGDTRKKIAKEKAGIIKENVLVIIGESDEEVGSVFLSTAINKKSPIYFMSHNEIASSFERNRDCAFQAIDYLLREEGNLEAIKDRAVKQLYKNTGLYGRDYIYSENPLIIMDAGHNVIGVKRFLDKINREYKGKRIRVLYGASSDKDITEIVKLFPKEWEYYVTEFSSNRSEKIENFMQIEDLIRLNPRFFKNSKEAFVHAKTLDNQIDMLIVFGSFYLLEEII